MALLEVHGEGFAGLQEVHVELRGLFVPADEGDGRPAEPMGDLEVDVDLPELAGVLFGDPVQLGRDHLEAVAQLVGEEVDGLRELVSGELQDPVVVGRAERRPRLSRRESTCGLEVVVLVVQRVGKQVVQVRVAAEVFGVHLASEQQFGPH